MSPIFETDPKLLKKRREKTQAGLEKTPKKRVHKPLQQLHQSVGNQAVQRMVVQRSGEGAFDLDEETSRRIQAERSGGETLDAEVQSSLSEKFGEDFNGVRVHTGSEADALSHELGARAFTTGSDIFFRAGSYDPGSEAGQRLIAHELTHVLQQGGSAAEGNTAFRVNPPGDVYEQEADSMADLALSASPAETAADIQRQEEEEEELVQMQEEEEETFKGSDLSEVMAGEAKAVPEETTVKLAESAETIPGEAKGVPEETTEKAAETDLTAPEEEYGATVKPEEEEEISKL